jgi:hypothetical protein
MYHVLDRQLANLMLPVVFHQREVIQDVLTASIPTQVILVNTNVFMELQYEHLMVSGNVPVWTRGYVAPYPFKAFITDTLTRG